MIFNFVVDRDYENISTTKFSRFTVIYRHLPTLVYMYNPDPKINEENIDARFVYKFVAIQKLSTMNDVIIILLLQKV